jgi:hypothetical protein
MLDLNFIPLAFLTDKLMVKEYKYLELKATT